MDKNILKKLSEITPEEQRILDGEQNIDRNLYMNSSRNIIAGDKLLDHSKLITIRPHTRFAAFPEHTHDYVEMVYMCAGSTTHIINGTRLVLKEGDLLMLGQNARQSIEPAGLNDIAVNFIVKPSFFTGTLPFLGEEETPLRHFVTATLAGEAETGFLLFRVKDLLPVQNLIENLLYTLMENTPNRRGIHQMTMGLLFVQLLNHTENLYFASEEQNTVMAVLRYIEEHYRDGSLNEIAGILHYDLSALSRLIKQKTGKTYTELLQEKRLSQAAWFLRNTDQNIDALARMVGYENTSYFYRRFTAVYGMSPRKYRIASF